MNEPTPMARRDRKLAAGLVVSLAVNAFFVGAFATDFIRSKMRDPDTRPLRFELRWFEDRLSSESVSSVESAIMSQRSVTAAHVSRLRQLREELVRMLAEPSPDRARIDDQLEAIRRESSATQETAQTATIDALIALPPDARAALANPPQ